MKNVKVPPSALIIKRRIPVPPPAPKRAISHHPIQAAKATVELKVPEVRQPTDNVCWAAAGYAVSHFGGHTNRTSLGRFVNRSGNDEAKDNYRDNQVGDIDEIVGSLSNNNLLAGSDDSGSYSKSVITKELNAGRPMIANVDGEHYVVICGKRKLGTVYQIKIMDPATGMSRWVDTDDGLKTTMVGGHEVTTMYYTK